jgi:ribonuclease H / adenosylcobalamin/alpha-ribazole phosphatase
VTGSLAPAHPGDHPHPLHSDTIGHPVLLIRHAETSWTGRRWCGRADPVLSAKGHRAARRLANDIAGQLALPPIPSIEADSGDTPPDQSGGIELLVSPARRARQTAAFLEAALGVASIVEPDLVEVDVGAAEGLDWAALERGFPTIAAEIARGFQPNWPAGESRADVDRRAARMADRIRAAATERTVIVVSHGAILHAMAALLAENARPPAVLGPAAILRIDPPAWLESIAGPAVEAP